MTIEIRMWTLRLQRQCTCDNRSYDKLKKKNQYVHVSRNRALDLVLLKTQDYICLYHSRHLSGPDGYCNGTPFPVVYQPHIILC